MTSFERVMLGWCIGMVMGVCVVLASEDWRSRTPNEERIACKDEPDRKAYMARLPGEAHTVESCVKVMRYGNPRWTPYFTPPMKGTQ